MECAKIEDEIEKNLEKYKNACKKFDLADNILIKTIGSPFFMILAYVKYIGVIFISWYYFESIGLCFGALQ